MFDLTVNSVPFKLCMRFSLGQVQAVLNSDTSLLPVSAGEENEP